MERALILVEGGHIHRAQKVNGEIHPYEGCWLDGLTFAEITGEELSRAEPHQLCGRVMCFSRDMSAFVNVRFDDV